jgi:hypothetical protein
MCWKFRNTRGTEKLRRWKRDITADVPVLEDKGIVCVLSNEKEGSKRVDATSCFLPSTTSGSPDYAIHRPIHFINFINPIGTPDLFSPIHQQLLKDTFTCLSQTSL